MGCVRTRRGRRRRNEMTSKCVDACGCHCHRALLVSFSKEILRDPSVDLLNSKKKKMLDLRALIAFAVVGISLATGGRAAASDGTRKVYDFGAQKQKGFLHAPPIPRWGGNASTLSFVASVNMTDISDSPEGPTWTFKYTYDGARNSSCYEHGPGQHDEVCKSIDKALTDQGHACTVLSSTDGHLYVSFPSDDKCCKCRHGFAVRSDWLFENSSYVGRGTVEGKTTDEWLKQGASDVRISCLFARERWDTHSLLLPVLAMHCRTITTRRLMVSSGL